MAVRRDARSPGEPAKTFGRMPDGCTGDVRIIRSAWTTIRFANGRIHQPHLERSTLVSLRVADGKRLATATGSDASTAGLDALAATARAMARVAPLEKRFPGFPRPTGRSPGAVPFSQTTASVTPEEATRLAEEILASATARAPGARVSGVVNVGGEWRRVANSSGLDRTTRTSMVQATVLVDRPERDPPVSGWSEGAHWNVARFRPGPLGEEAAERMARTTPAPVEPGPHAVVLRGPAVSTLLSYLAYLGFGGNGEVEGWSCLARKRGKKVAPSTFSLVDDARAKETIPSAIDYEGTWTERTPLVDRGVARDAVTDLLTSGRLRRKLTGHAQPPEAPFGDYGPVPEHLALAAGDASEDELIRETRRGILVTRFHYVIPVDPARGIITGMTRDGSYVIDRGEVVGPARNLRFTESVLTAIAGTTLLGKERRTYAGERPGGSVTAPAMAVRSFRFTSATLF